MANAGACPPRSVHGKGQALVGETSWSRFFPCDRGMARDRPSPYEKKRPGPVARGPVPRDLRVHERWRGTGPRPTKKTARYRSAGACPPRSSSEKTVLPVPVARGPVPRDRCMASFGIRRSRTTVSAIVAWRGTGPRPTKKRPVPVARGPVPRDLSSTR